MEDYRVDPKRLADVFERLEHDFREAQKERAAQTLLFGGMQSEMASLRSSLEEFRAVSIQVALAVFSILVGYVVSAI